MQGFASRRKAKVIQVDGGNDMTAFVRFMLVWGGGFVAFTMVDLLWIGVIAAPIYRTQLGPVLVSGQEMGAPQIVAALATWLVITFALAWFAMPERGQSWLVALGGGAMLGFIMYAVYDLTNLAVLRGWTLKVTVIDILWGTSICACVAVLMNGLRLLLTKSPA